MDTKEPWGHQFPTFSNHPLPPSAECQITERKLERVRVPYYLFPPKEELPPDWLTVQKADALITETESEDNLQTAITGYKNIF